MEFEKDAPVSDEQRQLAEAKKITVQPAHTNIIPEDISDSEIANQHINGQPIGNVRNDIEQDMPTLRPADDTTHSSAPEIHKRSLMMIVIIVGVACIIIAASLFVILMIK
ncbi:MAG: hypothetical protein JWP06_695 [Candidatus Saccharibacteria bacterium]|nr:hypothetical protein [Candidatus Saccharibacteria bacterium]